MTFLPIVERELLVASRRHATYSTRLVVALVAIVIGIFFYIANLRTPKHLLAHYIFQGLAVGIFSSALSKNARRAMGANFLWFILLGFTLPAGGLAIAYLTPSHLVVPELLFSCPVYSFYLSVASRYPFEAGHFWWSIATV